MKYWEYILIIIPIIHGQYIIDKNNSFIYNGPPMQNNVLPNNYFLNLQNLKEITITHIFLQNVEIDAFKNLNFVTYINLAYNEIATLPSNIFLNTPNLEYILLNDNKITNIQQGLFTNLTNLKHVILNNNNISFIDSHSFINTPSVNLINLYQNNLKTLTNFIVDLKSLQTITLSNNPWKCDEKLCEIMTIVVGKFWQESFPIYCVDYNNGSTWKSVVENNLPAIDSDVPDVATNNINVTCRVCARVTLRLERDGHNITNRITRTDTYPYLTFYRSNIKKYMQGEYTCYVNGDKNNFASIKVILKPASATMRILTWSFVILIILFVAVYFIFFYKKNRTWGFSQTGSMFSLLRKK